MILHDLRCTACKKTWRDVRVTNGDFGTCRCGAPRTWVPVKIATDMKSPAYNHATGKFHSSQREVKMELAKQNRAWSEKTGMRVEMPIEAGDPVRGARTELTVKGSVFEYKGRDGRKRTIRPGGPNTADEVKKHGGLSRYAVSGITPKRLSAGGMQEHRRTQHWSN